MRMWPVGAGNHGRVVVARHGPISSSVTSSADACRRARQFTLILHASKRLPKQCVDYLTGKAKQRRTVGVRLPGDAICQVGPAPAPSCRRPRALIWLCVFQWCGVFGAMLGASPDA